MEFSVPQVTSTGLFKEGVGIRVGELKKWLSSGELKKNMLCSRAKNSNPIQDGKEFYIMSDVEKAYEEANESISRAEEAYHATIARFRSTIKNDLSSISSSASKTVNESEKINTAYAKAISQLTSADMEKAIQNAERLASALKTISDAKSTEVYFKLFDLAEVEQ